MFIEVIVMYPIHHRCYHPGIDNLLVLLIGGIPIAMSTVLSVTMAIGSHRLSKQGALTKRMTAIEEMAGMDVLCSDKIGTLTRNRLSVDKNLIEALRGQPLTVYGDGKQTRSFQYVSDLVGGLMALLEGDHIGPFNLGNPGEFTMLELAEVVKETIDSSATIEFKANTADDPHMRKPDITKARELLKWEPRISLREGLPLLVTDFRKRTMHEYKKL